ncbi:hypothetical protein WJX73_007519 [Symbiochloris irregularis]|uniref:BRO1 domain-containing protein n=1 Tax=Symbiochloris irregularis TaxID=706552 RepID=A0AAW1NYN2_9CHLO
MPSSGLRFAFACTSAAAKYQALGEVAEEYRQARHDDYQPVSNAPGSHLGNLIDTASLQIATNVATCVKQAFWGRVVRYVQSREQERTGRDCNSAVAGRLAKQALRPVEQGEPPVIGDLRNLMQTQQEPQGGWKEPEAPHEVMAVQYHMLQHFEARQQHAGYRPNKADRLFSLLCQSDGFTAKNVKVETIGLYNLLRRHKPALPADIVSNSSADFTAAKDESWAKQQQQEAHAKASSQLNISDHTHVAATDPGRTDVYVGTTQPRFTSKADTKASTTSFSSGWYFKESYVTTSRAKTAKWQRQNKPYRAIVDNLPHSPKTSDANRLKEYVTYLTSPAEGIAAPTPSKAKEAATPKAKLKPVPRLDYLLQFHMKKPCRGLRFTRHCGKLSAITTMARALLGPDPKRTLVGWGDRGKAGQGFIRKQCGPSDRVRKALQSMCTVVDIDEFRTSKICADCGSILKPMEATEKPAGGGTGRKTDSYRMRLCIHKGCHACVNRDGLISQPGQSSPAPDSADADSLPLPANAPLRQAVAFQWQDVLVTNPQRVAGADAVFELASFLVAWALWQMRCAAALCQPGSAGSSSANATTAYKLLRSAAGKFDFVREKLSGLLHNSVHSTDCNPQALAAFSALCLADAQSITVLRAIQKGNQAGLVSSLATDTATMYLSAAQSAQAAPYAAHNAKCVAYANYKSTSFQAYAHAFAGQELAQSGQAGQAVRCLYAAQPLVAHAGKGAAAYDRAPPATRAADRTHFDADLSTLVDTSSSKVKRENDIVYCQRVPDEIPELPAGKRLAAPIPWQLPPAAAEARADALHRITAPPSAPVPAAGATARASSAKVSPAEGAVPEEHAEGRGGSCWRWLLVIIAMPFLVVLSVIGAVIWIVLLPLKIVCCPCGCLIQCMADIVEYILKAPFRGLMWASGKPWKSEKPAKKDKHEGH